VATMVVIAGLSIKIAETLAWFNCLVGYLILNCASSCTSIALYYIFCVCVYVRAYISALINS